VQYGKSAAAMTGSGQFLPRHLTVRTAALSHPKKLPRRPFAIEAVAGHSRQFGLRKNIEAFGRRPTMKYVTDLPIAA
jgi:hypothetical protein